MKNLFNRIFKKEVPIDYIIAEYQPIKIVPPKDNYMNAEYDIDERAYSDEMEIDNIHRSN